MTKKLIALCACPMGLAHTFMAAEAIEVEARKRGYEVKVETQGSDGINNKLTLDDIQSADIIIHAIAVTPLEVERFNGHEVFEVSLQDIIKHTQDIFNELEESQSLKGALKETIFTSSVKRKKLEDPQAFNQASSSTSRSTNGKSTWSEISKHLMTGISYMIPVLIMGGLIGAFSQLIPYVILGLSPDVSIVDAMNSGDFSGFHLHLLYIAKLMETFGFTLFGFAIPIFAAFTAFSIGGKTAWVSGFIGGYLAVKPMSVLQLTDGSWTGMTPVPSGFLGAILIAFAIGYFVKFMNDSIKLPKDWLAFKTTFLIPFVSALATMVIMIYVITPVGGALNTAMKSVLSSAGKSGEYVYATILAATTAFDLGGPVNKAAGFVALGFTTEKMLPVTARCMAIVIPSFGLGLSVLIDKLLVGRRVYAVQFREVGKTAIFLGFMGISEGAIPFALERPTFVIPLYVVGAVIGALIGVGLGAVQWFPESAIWAWPLITNIIPYILGLIIGSVFIAVINIYYRNYLIKKGEIEIL